MMGCSSLALAIAESILAQVNDRSAAHQLWPFAVMASLIRPLVERWTTLLTFSFSISASLAAPFCAASASRFLALSSSFLRTCMQPVTAVMLPAVLCKRIYHFAEAGCGDFFLTISSCWLIHLHSRGQTVKLAIVSSQEECHCLPPLVSPLLFLQGAEHPAGITALGDAGLMLGHNRTHH